MIAPLGFGAMRLPPHDQWEFVDMDRAVPLLVAAIERGVNYIDTAYVYPMSEQAVGKALARVPAREVYVSTKNIVHENDPKAWRAQLDESIERLGRTPDVLHVHDVSWQAVSEVFLAGGLLKTVRRAQDEGLFRFLGVSSHDTPENIGRILDTGEFDVTTLQHNVLFRNNADVIARAHQRGMGVVIMGPLGGGRLVALDGDGADTAELTSLALRFVLTDPNVDVVLSGMHSMQQLEQNLRSANEMRPLTGAEVARLGELARKREALKDLYCTGCGYCLPCPAGVDIRRAFLLYNQLKVAMHDPARLEYNHQVAGGSGVDRCTQCGACLPKCPQHIEIPDKLQQAHKELTTW